jgi:glycosyltransferase involved in cell wall biosynthesis
MHSSSRELEKIGYAVEHLFADDLSTGHLPTQLRRFVVPGLIVRHVRRSMRRGAAFDVVEIHEPSAAAYVLLRRLAPRGYLPPCVVLSHGLEERGRHAELEGFARRGERSTIKSKASVTLRLVQARLALRHADHVVVLSSEDLEYLTREMGVARERVTLGQGGVEPDLFDLLPQPRDSCVRILFLGTWIDRKGVPELTKSWTKLSASRSQVSLTAAGTGLSASEVLSRFPEAARASVAVIPRLERRALRDVLARHDVFVLPSSFEGMPLSMLEAAAAGLPCVVSAVCGILDFIRREDPQRDGGLLVAPYDVDGLTLALAKVIDDHDLRKSLGAAARARARLFTWRDSALLLAAAYRAATG